MGRPSRDTRQAFHSHHSSAFDQLHHSKLVLLYAGPWADRAPLQYCRSCWTPHGRCYQNRDGPGPPYWSTGKHQCFLNAIFYAFCDLLVLNGLLPFGGETVYLRHPKALRPPRRNGLRSSLILRVQSVLLKLSRECTCGTAATVPVAPYHGAKQWTPRCLCSLIQGGKSLTK